ncbi:MAG: hypothetical protein ACKV2V_26595, partial [Blastocatellia bacterium]
MKRMTLPGPLGLFCPVIFLLCAIASGVMAQTATPTPTPTPNAVLSSFQRTDTLDKDLILRGASDDGRRFVFESDG